jgi:anthranilate phosphoribosyltransferase
MSHTPESEIAFARFVAILGRGPGRSRALTRDEAREAFAMILANHVNPLQIGAFMMLLRFRGEDADEIAGMVEASRAHCKLGGEAIADLDWPSYGAGRTRGAPWFVLAALALARSGMRVSMHGSNDFSSGIAVGDALTALGIAPCANLAEASGALQSRSFAYMPLASLAPEIERLLGLRRLFGLRSPVNTVARLLNPGNAPAGVDGVFHPPYIDVHLGVAERLGMPRLLVLKGGGGEAERAPGKSTAVHLWRDGMRSELILPPVGGLPTMTPKEDTLDLVTAVWRGEAEPPAILATIRATIELGLIAAGRPGDPAAIWSGRLGR